MLAAVLLLSLAGLQGAPGQAPDRSTPEKACKGLVRWRETLIFESLDLIKAAVAAEGTGFEHLTGEARADAEQRFADMRERLRELTQPAIGVEVMHRTTNEDGTVTLDVKLAVGRSARLARMRFEKVGPSWLLHDALLRCPDCSGEDEHCDVCGGAGFVEDRSYQIDVKLALPAAEPKFSDDWSTARAAAQAYADLLSRRVYESNMPGAAFISRSLKQAPTWYAPELLEMCRKNARRSTRERPRRYLARQMMVKSFSEEGETAKAVLLPKRPQPWSREVHIELGKTGEQWRIVRSVERDQAVATADNPVRRTVKGVEFEVVRCRASRPGVYGFQLSARHGGTKAKTCYGRLKLYDARGEIVGAVPVFLKVGPDGSSKKFEAETFDERGRPRSWKKIELEMSVVGRPVAGPGR